MATKKRKTTTRRSTSRKKRAEQRLPAGLGTLFAGLLLVGLAFVEGDSVWKTLHQVLFGLFGCGSFVLGAAVCCLAVLYTRGEDLLPHICKLALGLVFASGTVIVFSDIQPQGLSAFQMVAACYQNGYQAWLSGGALGAVLGGNLLLAGGGLGTVGAETVAENDHLQRTLDYFKEVNETSERQPDYDFIEKMLPETGRAIDWLTNDFGLEHTSTDRGDYVRTNFGGNGAVFTDSLTKLLEKEGVTVLLNTKGEHILMEDGKAAGMEVSNRSGSYKIYADKVIVATGGASHDWDRMVEANPELETIDFYDEAAVSSTGDGFNMMEEIGAQMDVGPYIKSAYPDVSPVFAYTYANSPTQQNELVVNADGERVANESPYNQMYFNKQMLRQASSAYYAIFDESKMADYFLSDVQKLVERDDNTIVVKADTLEELAEKIGAANLVVTPRDLRPLSGNVQEWCG